MTDENGGFFSDADNSGSYEGYSYNEPAPATESDPQPTQPQEIEIQPVSQPNPEVEALRQQLAQEQQRGQRFEQDWNRFKEVFHPEQKQDPSQAALNEFVANPNTWAQSFEERAVNKAVERMQYENAEQEVLKEYPALANMQHLIRTNENIQQGFLQFQQKNGRPPQTPREQVKAAVDAFITTVGFSNQTQPQQQASNTIPLSLRTHNPSKEFDPSTASSEDFHKFVQAKVAKQYQ